MIRLMKIFFIGLLVFSSVNAATLTDASGRDISLAVKVDNHGAVGNGIALDCDGINAAITVAGVNGIIEFTPGKTYLVNCELTPLQGQIWLGAGATIKRANEVTTTSDTDILTPASVTTIAVADSTGFTVGGYISVWDGVDPTTTGVWDKSNRKITAISGNDITVSTSFNPQNNVGTGVAITGTVTVFSSLEVIVSNATDIKVYDITINGNLANNTTFERWENHVEIDLTGMRSKIENCYIYNAQSEGIELGGDGSTARGNIISSTNGNGIHLTAANGVTVDGNWLYNTNILGLAPGHADGAITISTDVVGAVISNNYLDGNNNSLAFVGGINETTGDMKIVDNHAKDTVTYAVEAQTAFATATSTFLIANNTFDNCVSMTIDDTGAGSGVEINNVNITGNIFKDTLFDVRGSNGVSITNNVVDNLSETTSQGFQITTSNDVAISGNSISGGTNVIIVNSGDNIVISNNIIRDGTTGTNNVMTIGGGTNVVVVGNLIEAASIGSSAAALSITTPDVLVQGNTLNIASTTGFVIGIQANTSGDRVRVIGNTISIPTTEAAIFISSGGDDCFVSGNFAGSDIYIAADTCFVNNNRVEGTGKTIIIQSGATGNVVINNAVTAAISDSGISTVTTSQNHVL